MEIRELRAFVIVAEELNFRKASDRLGMSQPPLTRLINQFEERLGVTLFKRTTRSVELTGEGLYLLKRSRHILEEVEKTELEVRSLQKQKFGKLRLSLTGPSLHSEAPKLINAFKREFPKIAVEISETPVSSLVRGLKSGSIDIFFGANEFQDPILRRMSVQTHELGLMIPNENPLSQKKCIKLGDLHGETLIFHGKHEHLGFQSEFLEFLKKKGIHVQVYYKKHNENCGNLVTMGKGILISSLKLLPNTVDVSFVPFAEFSAKAKIFACWSSENESVALKAFLSFLEERTLIPRPHMDQHFA